MTGGDGDFGWEMMGMMGMGDSNVYFWGLTFLGVKVECLKWELDELFFWVEALVCLSNEDEMYGR